MKVNEAKLHEYLKENLSREAKEKYKIYIFTDEEDHLFREDHRKYFQKNKFDK
ncbi:UNVERIFIED_CONTAM: phage coat protein [Bacillus amyloliquefaciens DSM 7 = ATCC 23350]|uniref:Prophage-derived-like uncharacterized protein yozM n=1 Tax=Bacillus amyloliquefaciens (strain ATCC 23350 / DSM 7 / BCRC 11601 / CCUG 28519 / NBRC 15535 / NRRL B-14393 / F) TaxID=692420 RepID=A0A9P1JG40_BACAS|nr:hypothetical protein [Bacillus amyloliquefaciens]AEB62829.1 Prophage-derived-like uncharacterized protein yozM [Bacillus amyloliquefaciens LL3]AEK89419.1 putative bacteriophage protein [Bacillus amyloliquefaciens XH7]MCM3247118.1 phage coat protein [Bacillus amyloliquefaciens]MCY7426599.1 phage coat protein [Bacillus amyloliquefaciens]MDR4375562.1 phage coat protein [Bacillus amyloliquefaciens]